jgi:hypothetical protein
LAPAGRTVFALCLAAILRATCVPALAQAPFVSAPTEPARELKEGKVVHAFRIKAVVPLIDGSLGDEAWMAATHRRSPI